MNIQKAGLCPAFCLSNPPILSRRKDESGKKLDKKAMFLCSKALGHNRIEVVANNYIRGL